MSRDFSQPVCFFSQLQQLQQLLPPFHGNEKMGGLEGSPHAPQMQHCSSGQVGGCLTVTGVPAWALRVWTRGSGQGKPPLELSLCKQLCKPQRAWPVQVSEQGAQILAHSPGSKRGCNEWGWSVLMFQGCCLYEVVGWGLEWWSWLFCH